MKTTNVHPFRSYVKLQLMEMSGDKRVLWGPAWEGRLFHAAMMFSVLVYTFIYVNLPLTLIPGGMHDDGFFMLRGMSMVAGEWMGAYNQYTLIKGAGYPLFLAVASVFHIPATLAHALLFSLAAWLLAVLTRKLFHSIWIALAVFEVVLWNFGPETSRIVRDAIYHAQFLLCFALLPLAFLASARWRLPLGALAGLAIGWLMITREEGLVGVPAFAMIAFYFLFMDRRNKPAFRGHAAVAVACIVCALMPPLLVSARNLRRYHQFESVDTQGDFAAAMSALESIEQAKEKPFLAVSREVRDKAYAVSPTFARLRPLIDEPGTPQLIGWKNAGCQYIAATCGDYGVGWFMWGLRDAAAMNGAFADAHTSSLFFRAIKTEISQACSSGRLKCHSSPLPLVPHVTADEIRSFPNSFTELVRRLLFLVPPGVGSGPSVGTLGQMQDAASFTNVYNFIASPALAPVVMNTRPAQIAMAAKAFFIRIYSVLLPVLLPAGLVAFLLCVAIAVQRHVCPLALVLVAAAWTAIVLRFAVLALIDVTSFGTLSNLYISMAFPLSCFAAVAAFPLVSALLKTVRVDKSVAEMPKTFRGVGETERRPNSTDDGVKAAGAAQI